MPCFCNTLFTFHLIQFIRIWIDEVMEDFADLNVLDFFDKNTAAVNRTVMKILCFVNILPITFFLFTKIRLFSIEKKVIAITAAIIVPITLIDCFFVLVLGSDAFKKKSARLYVCIQNFTKYFCLVALALFLAFLGAQSYIGIYISYGIVVFLSCLYYDVKTTNSISVVCYVFMLVSLFLRCAVQIDEGQTQNSFLYNFLVYAFGFTLEFLFVFLIANVNVRQAVNTLNQAIDQNQKLKEIQYDIMEFMSKLLESHDILTGRHTKHTVKYVDMIARELRRQGKYLDELTDENINLFSRAANLHDIGKVHIPDYILNKAGKLTEAEFQMMKEHPIEGKRLIDAMPIVSPTFNKIAGDMAFYHHERYDGKGYPNGIAGNDIPLCARIMAVADVLDALLSRRVYKNSLTLDEAMQFFAESSGKNFEPAIIDALNQILPMVFMESEEFKSHESDSEDKEIVWRMQLQGNL